MTAGRPVKARAILTAFSTASAPVLKKIAFLSAFSGATSQRRSARRRYDSYITTWKDVWVARSSWARTASMTWGWAWPTFITPMPPTKSTNRRPLTSQSSEPLACPATRGWAVLMPLGTYFARSSVSSASRDCFSTLTGPFKQIRSATVEAVDAAVERLWPRRRAAGTVLGGGITNHNFKVEVDVAAYVLRMGGAKTGLLGIDRAVEHAASLRAEEIGIGPPVADFVASEGWLVTRFIDGRPIAVEEMRSASTLPRIAEALRKLHSARAIPGRFDSFRVVDTYREEAEAN